MSIAILGWGSLIWCPGSLSMQGRWRSDGPQLPVEFARISGGTRLTLVVLPGTRPQPTFWTLSGLSKHENTVENLRIREGRTRKSYIHWIKRDGSESPAIEPAVSRIVHTWLEQHCGLDSVVWTGIPSNWQTERRQSFSPRDALEYVRELAHQENTGSAEEYIRNTPDVIRTEVRDLVEEDLGWMPNPLPPLLFEVPE